MNKKKKTYFYILIIIFILAVLLFLININIKKQNLEDLTEQTAIMRQNIIEEIWKQNTLPSTTPDKIESNIGNSINSISLTTEIEKIDKITINQEHGMNSIIYHIHPKNKNNNLIVYAAGHEENLLHAQKLINTFLDQGYSILTIYMPLFGENKQGTSFVNSMIWVFQTHNHLRELESENYSPLKLFLDPPIISLNYIENNYNYDSISMVGFSGGAWTTVLSAAVDSRIKKSYQLSGTFPMEFNGSGRDYEQNLPGLEEIAKYPDLYTLGSYGKGRKQIQILNQDDPCCFQGYLYREAPYEKRVNKLLKILNSGEFEVFIVDHDEHEIAEETIIKILEDLEN